jgi:K+-transporting ATPase ATPase A chain
MTANGWLQIALFLAAVTAVTVPLGRFMARVFARERRGSIPSFVRSSG